MRIRSLAEKIVLYFVTIGIIAIAVVSTYSFYTSKNALLNRTFDQLTAVRVVKKGQIEQFFNDRLSEMLLILNSENLPVDLKSENVAETDDCFILKHLQSSHYYEAIFFINSENSGISYKLKLPNNLVGREFSSKEFDIIEQLYTKSGSAPVLHDYIYDSLQHLPRMFITGLYTAGQGKKVKVALEISIDAINRIMLEKNPSDGMGHSGESYLVGNDGLMRSRSRFQSESILKTAVNTAGVKWAKSGITGTSVIDDYRNIKVLSSYSRINTPGLDWIILAEIDYKEATQSIYAIRNNILFLTIFVAAILFIISFIFSRRITSPLIKLNDAAKHIQKGDLNVSLPGIKNNEIGQLTNSFNEMAKSLQLKDSELQDERNKRFSAMIDGQELERQRLSRELHDGLGQSLIALKLKLSGIDVKNQENMQQTIEQTCSDFDDTINEIRRISNDLMPAVLLEFGLVTALKNICNSIVDNTDTKITFTYKGQLNKLDQKLTIYIFRIIQEALNNMVKHASATRAKLHIEHSAENISIVIEDNGKGISVQEHNAPGGSGIPNMRERVRLLNGEIVIESKPGEGTTLKIQIPLIKTKDE